MARYTNVALISAIIISYLLLVFTGWKELLVLIAGAIIAFSLQAWPRLGVAPRMLLSGAAISQALLLGFGLPLHASQEGYAQAALLSSLIASLALLGQVASGTSDMGAGARQLLAQPPARRYLALGLGSHLFSLFLNIGSAAMMTPLVAARRSALEVTGELRGALLAISRGFAACPMWGPLSVCIVVIVSLVPGVEFLDVLPGGLALAGSYMLIGYLLERRPRPPAADAASTPEPEEPPLPGWSPLLRIVLLVAVISGSAVTVEAASALSFGQSVLLVAFNAAILWSVFGAVDRRRSIVRQTGGAISATFGNLHNEVVIIAASGFLSVSLPALATQGLDAGGLAPGGSGGLSPLAAAVVLAATPWGLVLPGLAGINPIVSGSLLAALLPQMLPAELHLPLALGVICGWGATAGGSPFGANMLIISRLASVPAATLAIRWNGPLTMMFTGGFSLLVFAYTLAVAR